MGQLRCFRTAPGDTMRPAFAAVFCLPLVLTGCTLSPTTTETSPAAGVAIQGVVRGGQQSIVGAHIYLFAANTTGYGQPSVSLLNDVPGSTTKDTFGGATNNDYYVTSGALGAFSITGDYSCTANTQVYLYAVGGNPGLSPSTINNTAAGLLAVLGNCPGGVNAFLTATPYVVMNEVSTVAAAYAFAGFATDAVHVSSSGTPLAKVGIQNAFANAANLANLSTGQALAVPPSDPAGTAPQAAVYSIANILASCVNTNGTVSGPTSPTACYTLLTSALSGGTTGTQPTDTATVAINIAHNPGANVAALWGLITGTPAFGSGLTVEPNDFTLGLQLKSTDLAAPHSVAIDAAGNAWVANNGGISVTLFSSSGSVLSGTTGFTGGGVFDPDTIAIDLSGNAWITNYYGNDVSALAGVNGTLGTPLTGSPYSGGNVHTPYGIAIDGSGNAWITNYTSNSITELSTVSTPLGTASGGSPYTGLSLNIPYAVAIDKSGDVWIASKNNSAVTELSNSGAIIAAGYTGGSIDVPYGIAIDGSGNAWIANYGGISNSTISEIVSSGTALSPVSGSPYSESGSYGPQAIAIDGAGNAWVANNSNSSIAEFSGGGAMLSPSAGYTGSGTLNGPNAIAVDPSGNVWIANNSNNTVTELIGAAAPVVTPLAVGAKNNTLGTKP